jgi:hypothetical protein
MPIPQPFYVNGPSLGSATAIFSDPALTVCAPDGYYSDGTITRKQVNCVLLPQQTCPNCCDKQCSSWRVQSISGPFQLKYVNCGGTITVTDYPDPTDTVVCTLGFEPPIREEGNCTITPSVECGCCTTSCETWFVDNVTSVNAEIAYVDCFSGPSVITVDNGQTATICITSGTRPSLFSGTARIAFQFCDCI